VQEKLVGWSITVCKAQTWSGTGSGKQNGPGTMPISPASWQKSQESQAHKEGTLVSHHLPMRKLPLDTEGERKTGEKMAKALQL
jgi:hypothetical protein